MTLLPTIADFPTEKTPSDKNRRKEMFKTFDPNGNGYLSLAECDRGLLMIGKKLPKPVIMRAFMASNGVAQQDGKNMSKEGENYIEFAEFRLFLVFLQTYLRLWEIFTALDRGGDRRINFEEFKKGLKKLSPLGVTISDPQAAFATIDANGGGEILFDEFADWGLKQLHVEAPEPSVIASTAAQTTPLLSSSTTSTLAKTTLPPAVADFPTQKTATEKEKRKDMFRGFDPNGNGYLSLAECDRGLLTIGKKLPKPVILRAFKAANGVAQQDGKNLTKEGESYIEFSEFRLFLVFLQKYLQLWEIFVSFDKGADHRIDLDEFKMSVDKLSALGVSVEDPQAEFEVIDANGGGQILFDEFAEWGLKQLHNMEERD